MTTKLPDVFSISKESRKSVLRLTAQSHGLYNIGKYQDKNIDPFMAQVHNNSMLGSIDKAVIELLFLYGLRIGEVLSIGNKDVSFTGHINIKGSKGSDNRVVMAILYKSYWYHHFRSMLPLSSIYSRFYFYRLFKKLGYYSQFKENDNFSVTHFFRHQLIENLYSSGMSKENISQFIGHKSLTTIDYYV